MTSPDALVSHIAATIRAHGLFNPGETLIVGISGGADSTALLDLLTQLPDMPFTLLAAHLNHGLRGTESDLDEEFCREQANRYGLPFQCRRMDIKTLATASSLNLEDAGRRARIAYFDELSATWKAQAVVLAHHADDQAETVLMRLLRGSGMAGLSGMPYRNKRGYVRPLLEVTRSEIITYLNQRGLTWREDASNSDRTFLRNRIRHELLPLLEQYNPAVRKCLTDTAALLSEDNDLLEAQTTHTVEQLCRYTSRGSSLHISDLTALPPAMQRRVIRQMLSALCGNLHHFNKNHFDAICSLASSIRPNARLNLPRSIDVVKEYGELVFQPATDDLQGFNLEITAPGVYHLPTGDRLTIGTACAPTATQTEDILHASIDLDKAPFPWHVRTMQPGDRIQPLGMPGRKKVKDLFIDCKIPLSTRRQTPLIFSRNELIWVCGVRTSQKACLDDNSSQITKVVFSRGE